MTLDQRSSRRKNGEHATTAAGDGASPLVAVKKSKIQGRGVFAVAPIAKGQRILEYVGERIGHDEANARYNDEANGRHHTFLFTVDDDEVVDATNWGNEAKYINHSCEPNCEALIEKKRIFIYALRDIEPGEELLYDYWYTTDDTYTDEDLKRIYPCRCGAASCRGTIAAPRKKKKRAAVAKKKSAPQKDAKSAKKAKKASRKR